jgi:hypothetical protein
MGITRNQWIAIFILILSVNMGATAQLTDLFGAYAAKLIVSFSSIGSSILAGVQIILGGQGQQVKDVGAIQGADGRPAVRVNVNANAPPTVAAVALDPAQPNVGAISPDVRAALTKTLAAS